MSRRLPKSLLAAATTASLPTGAMSVAPASAATDTVANQPTLSLDNAGANTNSIMEGDTAYNNALRALGQIASVGIIFGSIIALYNFGVSKGIVPPVNFGR